MSNYNAMNNFYTILAMVAMLVFNTSCSESITDMGNPWVETSISAAEQRVHNLVMQARKGDVQAYNSLAQCYRDGDGVEPSWLNMLCMYAIYAQKTGREFEDVIEVSKEGKYSWVVSEIMDSSSDDELEARLKQLKQVVPAEVKAVEAAKMADSMNDVASAMAMIREAEDEGSELAVILQVTYYEDGEDVTGLEEYLLRVAGKYPVLNLMLGDLCVGRYRESKDIANIHDAIAYYYKADACGMLVPKYADVLLNLYDYFMQKGELECDEHELELLRVLSQNAD